MATTGIRIRPFESVDTAFAYDLAVDLDPAWLRVSERGLPLPTQFEEVLWRQVFALFTVVSDDGAPRGVAGIYAVNERAQYCSLEVHLVPRWESDDPSADEAEAAVFDRLLDRAFSQCGFRLAYVEYASWCPPVLDPAHECTIEGAFTDFLRHDGSYWDKLVLTVKNSELDGR